MLSVGSALSSHLAGELTTLADLVKITRQDGVTIGFTSHDADLTFDGTVYTADGISLGEAFRETATLKAVDAEMIGAVGGQALTGEDIAAGLYDHARVDVMLVNWSDLTQGALHARRGWLGEITIKDGRYHAALRGLHDLLGRKVGDLYTAGCRHAFCDAMCRLDVAGYTVEGSVTASGDLCSFVDANRTETSDDFGYGVLTWTSGSSAGLTVEVAAFDPLNKTLTLWLPMATPAAVGDTYRLVQGCNKSFSVCKSRFLNAHQFGGFPHLPGLGKILQYPDSQ